MIKINLIIFIPLLILTGCVKKEEDILKQMKEKPTQENIKMPDDSVHRNLSSGDETAVKLIKAADEADSAYTRNSSEENKKICIEKHMAAANYLMFEANLSPKKKYPPALRRYRRVLQLDPANKEALENKNEIEDIYRSMGMSIPD